MFFKRFISLFIIALLIALPALAQTPAATEAETKSPQAKEEELQKKLKAQALELLDAVIKDTERLTLPENRIYVSITTAYLLWPHDEEGARGIFKTSMADLRVILSNPVDEELPRAYRQKMERGQLRQRLLFALAARDGRMARIFMNETRPAESPKSDYGPAMDEDELEMGIAAVISTHDPAQALEMAQKSLAKGFSYSLPTLVTEIQKNDAEAAAKLAGDILSKLKTTNLTSNPEAVNVALRILYLADASQQSKTKKDEKKAQPLLTEQSMRELAELIISAAVNGTQEFIARHMDTRSVLPLLEKYAPARAQAFRRKTDPQGEGAEENSNSWREYQELSESGTPNELIAAAEKADPGLREAYYRQAAFKLANEGETEKARQIINQQIKEPQQRQQMLSDLDRQMMSSAAEKGKLAETRQLLSRARTNEERINVLSQLALAIAPKDKKTALQLLDEARSLNPARAKYSRQMLAQLQLARAYAAVDAQQSFPILETSIEQLNELISAAILLGEFFGEEEFVRDDEVMVQPFVQMVDTFQQQYGSDLLLLARADFARTRDAAEKFQRPEVRLFARLLVAQSVLAKKDSPKNEEDGKASPPPATASN
jgi:hypothetical protein